MTTKILTIRIPCQVYSELCTSAAELGVPVAAYVRRLIEKEHYAEQVADLRVELLTRLDRLASMASRAPVATLPLDEILLLARATAAHLNPQLVGQVRIKLAGQQEGANVCE